jgi:hypothetical protein
MRRSLMLLFILQVSFQNYGQGNNIPVAAKKKNYYKTTGCILEADDPAHFDPYYNGHLCENFNPEQVDFSQEYLKLETKYMTKTSNILPEILKYNFSHIWPTNNTEQNGVLGRTYERIRIHIDDVSTSKNRYVYLIRGASNVANNICRFKGTIKLLQAYLNDSCYNSTFMKCGNLFAEYAFFEDSLQNHSGMFKGITECSFQIDSTDQNILLDESMDGADGYWNRSFVGTWTEYKTGIKKKCIWGDYRLPFTFDFDCGDGEMMVCEQYKKNGWQTFGDGTEFISIRENKRELKNKWWQQKK